VRDRVTALLVRELRVTEAEAQTNPIKKLVARCDGGTQSLIAAAINHDWPHLNGPFAEDDVSCDDTVDTLANEITNRMT
jgi:predicted HD phosphohydrolase